MEVNLAEKSIKSYLVPTWHQKFNHHNFVFPFKLYNVFSSFKTLDNFCLRKLFLAMRLIMALSLFSSYFSSTQFFCEKTPFYSPWYFPGLNSWVVLSFILLSPRCHGSALSSHLPAAGSHIYVFHSHGCPEIKPYLYPWIVFPTWMFHKLQNVSRKTSSIYLCIVCSSLYIVTV